MMEYRHDGLKTRWNIDRAKNRDGETWTWLKIQKGETETGWNIDKVEQRRTRWNIHTLHLFFRQDGT